ncbi:hypothetical protein EGI16_17720 [Chryseobacterium sp. G0240]|nr:hypothetical protein EGI16_17720 [Chryseobacterium sp. G0240]
MVFILKLSLLCFGFSGSAVVISMTKFRHSAGQKQRRKPHFGKGKTPFLNFYYEKRICPVRNTAK